MLQKPEITFLTRPIDVGQKSYYLILRAFLKNIWYGVRGIKIPEPPEFGGHSAVTRSVIHGFRNIGIPVNLDPESIEEVADTVHVLSDVNALKQAISWKQNGEIKKLVAGPNLVLFPSDEAAVIGSEAIDRHLVPSKWVQDLYQSDLEIIKNKLFIWPAGVDLNFWNTKFASNKTTTKDKILIYMKSKDIQQLKDVQNILNNNGQEFETVTYGKYEPIEFRQKLTECNAVVFINESESQGLALAECWAMDVPTFVFSPSIVKIRDRLFTQPNFSTAPYLSEFTGEFWFSKDELIECLDRYLKGKTNFEPRKWVQEKMSDEKSAEILYKLYSMKDH